MVMIIVPMIVVPMVVIIHRGDFTGVGNDARRSAIGAACEVPDTAAKTKAATATSNIVRIIAILLPYLVMQS
jgi:hypothetical protein